MLKRPQWVKEKIEGREKEIPLQMTVKKKYSMQPDNSYMGMETISAMNTGAGVDGMVQPGKMVDVQVHEGEGIIPNNAMQGLTGEEFQGLIETLSTGDIDKNKLREAINMPTVAEYQTGGTIDRSNSRSRGIPTEEENPKAVGYPNPVENQSGTTLNAAEVTREQPKDMTIQVRPPVQQTIQTEEVKPAIPSQQTVAEFKPPPPIKQETLQTETVTKEEPTTETKVPAAEDTTTQETVTTTTVSPAGEMVHKGLQQLMAQSEGVTDTDRKILDFYMQNIDAAEAANLRVLESRISADPDMSEQGKQAAIRGLQREAAARRSQEVGKMAISAAERATQATKDLITYGGDVRRYEEITLPEARQNMEIKDWTFENHTKPLSLLEVEELQNKLGADNWDRITEMINDGYPPNKINAELAKMGLEPLSIDEYAAVYKATDLGERNWDRQLGLAEMQLELGDFEAAATSFDNLYPGVNIDFSKLVTKENAEMFNTGLKQMATYIEANYNVDEALDMARQDGTLEFMGVDEEQFARFYNAKKVNALDAQWEEVETSKEYQRLLNSTDPAERQKAQDTRDYYWMNVLGILDRDTLHEYKIYKNGQIDPNNPSVYARNEAEAQAKVDALGEGYSVEKTGLVTFVEKEEPTTELTSDRLTSKWETFKETVPDDVDINDNFYKTWETWQVENPDAGYNEFIKTPVGKLTTVNIDAEDGLLNNDNSNTLLSVYKEDPDAVKNTNYYYTPPFEDDLREGLSTGTGGFLGTGKTSTNVTKFLRESFDSAEGKITELPMKDGTVVGQVQDVVVGPGSVTFKIKTLDNEVKNIAIYESDEGSYRPKPKYYGRE